MPGEMVTWSDADTEKLFANIGRYVVFFQWMEGKLDQILLLGWGYENWKEGQARLARMRNHEKVSAVEDLVLNSPLFQRTRERPDFCDYFRRLIEHVREAARQRNTLLHSQYLFEFTEIGLPPIGSDRRRDPEGYRLEQVHMSPDAQNLMLRILLSTAVELNLTHAQLIRDSRREEEPERSEPDIGP